MKSNIAATNPASPVVARRSAGSRPVSVQSWAISSGSSARCSRIAWAISRVLGEVDADDAISGRLPKKGDLNVEGLDVDDATLQKIFALDPHAWAKEADLTEEYFKQFGKKLPQQLRDQLDDLRDRIGLDGPHNS